MVRKACFLVGLAGCFLLQSTAATAKQLVSHDWRGVGTLTIDVTPVSATETVGMFHNEETGRSTHLGRTHNVGDGMLDLVTGAFLSGEGTITAANSDTITWVLSDDGTEVIVTGGTGRFKNASGWARFEPIWQQDPEFHEDGTFTIVVKLRYRGELTY